MVCKKCKKRIRKDEVFCHHCGAPQTETVSLGAINAAQMTKKKPKRGKKVLTVIGIILLVLALLACGLYYGMLHFLDSNLDKEPELHEHQVDVNPDLPPSGVTNIALFGLDNRFDKNNGRSDAIIILSVDYDHNKIKLTSIARDTLVYVDGYPSYENKTKITHAFYWGALKPDTYGSGAQLAVKTLNQNFGMNITKYMFVNFHEFAELIDLVGGVDIEVKEYELYQLNKHIRGMVSKSGLDIDQISSAGMQTLSGGQALAYARLRKVDSDVVRGNRQRAVLEAAFNKVKEMPLTKYPALVKKALGVCNTNLDADEILKMAKWALSNSPEFVNMSLPDENASLYARGKNWNDGNGWVYRMDMNYVTAYLHDFIYETNTCENLTPVRPN